MDPFRVLARRWAAAADRHLRAAIIARDKHCRYPSCTAPPILCEGHHVQHWARDHGSTAVHNGIPLCWHHHDLIHRKDITVERADKEWVFTDRHGQRIGVPHLRNTS